MDVLNNKKEAYNVFQTLQERWPEIVASLPDETRTRYEQWRHKRPFLTPETDTETKGE